jgi:hypothetical protein
MMIKNNMPVVEAVEARLFLKLLHFILPLKMAKNKAQNAPIPAASVGVKMPMYSPPMTRINSTITSQVREKALIFSLLLALGPGGPKAGLRRVSSQIVMI